MVTFPEKAKINYNWKNVESGVKPIQTNKSITDTQNEAARAGERRFTPGSWGGGANEGLVPQTNSSRLRKTKLRRENVM